MDTLMRHLCKKDRVELSSWYLSSCVSVRAECLRILSAK